MGKALVCVTGNFFGSKSNLAALADVPSGSNSAILPSTVSPFLVKGSTTHTPCRVMTLACDPSTLHPLERSCGQRSLAYAPVGLESEATGKCFGRAYMVGTIPKTS